MEITKSWVMTEEYAEVITFDEDLVKLFIKQEKIEVDEDETIQDIADTYSDDLWEWAVKNIETEFIKDLFEYQEHTEPVDGYIHEYRFEKQELEKCQTFLVVYAL